MACTALLLKGSLDEKLLFCFRFSDIGKKNHLTPKECATFLDVVCRMGLVISQDNPNPYLLILMAKFKRMICKSITKKSKIKYADVQDLINQSMLIRELRAAFLKTARKSTLAVIQKKKRSLSSPTNTKKEMIESRETATITAHKKPASFQIPLEGEKQENDSQVRDSPFLSNKHVFVVFNGKSRAGEQQIGLIKAYLMGQCDGSIWKGMSKGRITFQRDCDKYSVLDFFKNFIYVE